MPSVEELLELLEEDPNDHMLRYGLGMEYLRGEQYAEAIAAFEQTIQTQPSYSVAYRELARCLMRLGQSEKARTILIQGKKVATEKSDLQVIKDIEQLLRELPPSAPQQ